MKTIYGAEYFKKLLTEYNTSTGTKPGKHDQQQKQVEKHSLIQRVQFL